MFEKPGSHWKQNDQNSYVSNQAIARELIARGMYERALSHLFAWMHGEPGNRSLRELVEMCLGQVLPAWHFRMLNDRERNEGYFRAIESHVSTGQGFAVPSDVLDVGSGSGLLTGLCLKAGAKAVNSCDDSQFMIAMAERVLGGTRFTSDMVQYFAVPSYALTLPRKPDLVVCELFDCGLLGEHFISVISDLRDRSVIDHTTPLVPTRAKIFVGLFESHDYRLGTKCHWKGEVYDGYAEQPYDSVMMRPESFKELARSRNAICIDFMDQRQLDLILSGRWTEDVHFDHFVDGGYIDCVALWFTLQLSDDVSISTCPFSGSCWQQAVWPEDRSHVGDEVLVLSVSASPTDGEHFVCRLLGGGRPPSNGVASLSFDRDSVQRMHHNEYQNAYSRAGATHRHVVMLTDCINSMILDACNPESSCRMLLVSETSTVACSFVNKQNSSRNITTVTSIDDIGDTLSSICSSPSLAPALQVVYEPCNQQGLMQRHLLRSIDLIKDWASKNNVLIHIFPPAFRLLGTLIESEDIAKDVSVVDKCERTCGINMATELNVFSPRRIFDMDPFSHKFKSLSEPIHLVEISDLHSLNDASDECVVNANLRISKPGRVDGLLIDFEVNILGNTWCRLNDQSCNGIPLFKRSAIICSGRRLVDDGDVIRVELILNDHYLEGQIGVNESNTGCSKHESKG